MHRSFCAALAAFALSSAALAADAPAAEDVDDSAAARDTLEGLCRDDGETAETCACLGDFVEENFTSRELEGAALVFADATLAEDPGAAIVALVTAGYTIEEITAVAERIVELETAAKDTCAVESAGDGSADD